MRRFWAFLRARRNERGATAVEYGLLMAGGAMALVFALHVIDVGLDATVGQCIVGDLQDQQTPAWCPGHAKPATD